MPEDNPKRRKMGFRQGLLLVVLVAAVGDGLAVWAWRVGRLDSLDLTTLLILCTVAGIVAAATAMTYTPGSIPDLESRDHWERRQRDLNQQLIFNSIGGLIWTGVGSDALTNALAEGRTWNAAATAGFVLLWLCVAPANLMGWPWGAREGLDDELSRVFRARAAATGFGALLLAGGVGYMLSVIVPGAALYAIPLALWFGGAVACAHFVYLHRQAEQGPDSDG